MTSEKTRYEQGESWFEVWINDVDGWTLARKFHGGQHLEAQDALNRWTARGVPAVVVSAQTTRKPLDWMTANPPSTS